MFSPNKQSRNATLAVRLITACCVLMTPIAAYAEGKGEFLLFPSVAVAHRTGIKAGDELKAEQMEGAVDFLATGNFDAFQFLGEYNYASDEKDLARLQLGWRIDSDSLISIGKFHNLQGYWNTQFHHGAYLQTTISRPGVIEDDGPLPTHYLGMQMDGKLAQHAIGSLDYSFGIGKGAHFTGKIESPEIYQPGRDGGLTIGLRLAYSLDEGSPNQAGLFLASNKIPANSNGLTEIKQAVWGVFGNWENESFRFIGEIYAFQNTLSGNCAPCTGTFTNAYVQGEYRPFTAVTVYGRLEDTSSAVNDSFVALVPEFAKRRTMAGLRYDLKGSQSIKLELSRTGRVETSFNQLQIQWSSVFP